MNTNKLPTIDTAASETEFVVDGKTYRLRYNIEAIQTFEKGVGFNPVYEDFKPTIANFSVLLFVGMLAHQPDINLETVQSWFFNKPAVAALTRIASQSFFGSAPEVALDGEENQPDPPRA
jgi:hypothetical protein